MGVYFDMLGRDRRSDVYIIGVLVKKRRERR